MMSRPRRACKGGAVWQRTRTVIDVYARTWHVRDGIEWGARRRADDAVGGRGTARVVSVAAAVVVLLSGWRYVSLIPGPVLGSTLLVVAVLLVVRWLLRRPWSIVAETPGTYDNEAERWRGVVYGYVGRGEEVRRTIRELRLTGIPSSGALHRVD